MRVLKFIKAFRGGHHWSAAIEAVAKSRPMDALKHLSKMRSIVGDISAEARILEGSIHKRLGNHAQSLESLRRGLELLDTEKKLTRADIEYLKVYIANHYPDEFGGLELQAQSLEDIVNSKMVSSHIKHDFPLQIRQ